MSQLESTIEWIDVKDEMPAEGFVCLVAVTGSSADDIDVVPAVLEEAQWFQLNSPFLACRHGERVTHWADLPEFPKGKKQSSER